jgi:hypothetical protein
MNKNQERQLTGNPFKADQELRERNRRASEYLSRIIPVHGEERFNDKIEFYGWILIGVLVVVVLIGGAIL